jgi:hypothetical protein
MAVLAHRRVLSIFIGKAAVFEVRKATAAVFIYDLHGRVCIRSVSRHMALTILHLCNDIFGTLYVNA